MSIAVPARGSPEGALPSGPHVSGSDRFIVGPIHQMWGLNI